MKKLKTKNYVKHKKLYLKDSSGDKYAPYTVEVFDTDPYSDTEDKLIDLAKRNSGYLKNYTYSSVVFEFFTPKGLKTFYKKATSRYGASIYISEAIIEVTYCTTSVDKL